MQRYQSDASLPEPTAQQEGEGVLCPPAPGHTHRDPRARRSLRDQGISIWEMVVSGSVLQAAWWEPELVSSGCRMSCFALSQAVPSVTGCHVGCHVPLAAALPETKLCACLGMCFNGGAGSVRLMMGLNDIRRLVQSQ